MKFMLDTNICIFLIKNKHEKIIRHMRRLDIGDIGISAITHAELQFGVAKSRSRQRNRLALDQFVAPLVIAPFDESAAEAYGTIRANLEKSGKPIGSLDTLIGAHALSLNVVLVTNNTREFRRIKNLKVVDWSV